MSAISGRHSPSLLSVCATRQAVLPPSVKAWQDYIAATSVAWAVRTGRPERARLAVAAEMRYEVTVDDPKTYVRPFKIGFPLTQEPGYQNFEYACHEGNYAMFDSLSGARAKEREAAAAAAKKQ